jgi:hypothetical protein
MGAVCRQRLLGNATYNSSARWQFCKIPEDQIQAFQAE